METNLILSFDGYCCPNPGQGGYGFVILEKEKQMLCSGSEPYSTNNRMEMTGCLRGLEECLRIIKAPPLANDQMKLHLHVIGDAEYVLKGASTWMPKWKKKPAQFAKKANLDLWMKIDRTLGQLEEICHEIHWWWVRGHTGFWLNELCDSLASMTVQSERVSERIMFKEDKREVDFSLCTKVVSRKKTPRVPHQSMLLWNDIHQKRG